MKRLLFLFCMVHMPIVVWACDYGDDPRLENDPAALIQAIRSGQETGQIQMTLATYLGMGTKTRELFGDNVLITSLDCKPVGVLGGDVIGKASLPFEAFYRAMARAIRQNKPETAKKLIMHGKVAPMPVTQYVDLFGLLPFSKTGGLKVREQMKKIFPAASRLPPKDAWLKDKAKQGRREDYTMARLFNVFGGKLNTARCSRYTLSEKFYTAVKGKSFLRGEYVRYITRQDPVHFMLNIMNSDAVFSDDIHYTIKGCTP